MSTYLHVFLPKFRELLILAHDIVDPIRGVQDFVCELTEYLHNSALLCRCA